jgi:3D-(3,5/4)-trihydroxycyclohexane-1,2-dione acylhydrolase (decyclizing)
VYVGELALGGLGVNGTRAANAIAATADVVLCVGTRLSDFTTGSRTLFEREDVRFVGLNVNAADAYKLSATPVVADAREGLVALEAALGDLGWRVGDDYVRELRTRRDSWRAALTADIAVGPGERLNQGAVLRTINETVREDDWVVAAAGWQPGDLLKVWETPPGSHTHIEFAFSCMGHEIPAGLGIRLWQRAEGLAGEVIVVIGDGTYLMNPTELVTAVQEGLKITVVIIDNGGYGSIDGLATGRTGGSVGNMFRARGVDGRFPDGERVVVDFVENARSMGCAAVSVGSADALLEALAGARANDGPSVIVCPVEGRALLDAGAEWVVGVAEVDSDAGRQP